MLAQPKRLALLAYLSSATPLGFHRRDTLLAMFWPDSGEQGARAALSRAVHYLRQSLGADAIVSRGDQELAIDRSLVTSDVAELGLALDRDDATTALGLYHGDFLAGFHIAGSEGFDAWMEVERLRLRSAVSRIAGRAVRAAEASGDLTAAEAYARRAMELAPSSEIAVEDFMRVLAASGNGSEALQAYETLVRHLRSELNAEPGAGVRAEADRIRRGGSSTGTRAPVGPSSGSDHPIVSGDPGQGSRKRVSTTGWAEPPPRKRIATTGWAEPALRLVDDAHVEAEAPPIAAPAPSAGPGLFTDRRTPPPRGRRAMGWGLAAVLIGGGAWLVARPGPLVDPPTVRFTLSIPTQIPPTEFGSAIALSPNGSDLVYVGRGRTRTQLYIRTLDQVVARPLPGTEDGQAPFFSPDGRWIGYWGGGELRKLPVEGGPSTVVAKAWWMSGATWLPGNEMVMGRHPISDRLSIVSAAGGGTPVALPVSDWGRWPMAVPGTRNILFIGESSISVATPDDTLAFPLGVFGHPVGVLDGAMIYIRSDGALMALPFDLAKRQVTGTPVQLLNGTLVLSAAIAPNGTLVYIRRSSASRAVLVDLSGNGVPLLDEPAEVSFPAVAPDGQRVAFTMPSSVGQSIFLYDIPSKTFSRLSFIDGERPAWSGDGRWVGFTQRTGYRVAADGSGMVDSLTGVIAADGSGVREITFSPDGRYAVLRDDGRETRRDLYIMPLGLPGQYGAPVPLEVTEFNELMPRVSPDSRFLAYSSDASGIHEVYVRPFPESGARLQVSSGGGNEPVWAPDGRGVYYRAGGNFMLAVLSTGVPLRVVERRVLFRDRYQTSQVRQQYDAMPDGRHLLVLDPLEAGDQEGQLAFVVLGWTRELRQQLAAAGQGPPK